MKMKVTSVTNYSNYASGASTSHFTSYYGYQCLYMHMAIAFKVNIAFKIQHVC